MSSAKAAPRFGDIDAVRLTPEDNVATVLRAVAAGERLSISCGAATENATALEPIPMCHKISLSPVATGSAVVKYGQVIGEATTAIAAGALVHVHNMKSKRAKRPS